MNNSQHILCDNLTHLTANPHYFRDKTLENNEMSAERTKTLDELVWEHITHVLAQHNGNVSAAARALGMHRRSLQRKLNRQGNGGQQGSPGTAP